MGSRGRSPPATPEYEICDEDLSELEACEEGKTNHKVHQSSKFSWKSIKILALRFNSWALILNSVLYTRRLLNNYCSDFRTYEVEEFVGGTLGYSRFFQFTVEYVEPKRKHTLWLLRFSKFCQVAAWWNGDCQNHLQTWQSFQLRRCSFLHSLCRSSKCCTTLHWPETAIIMWSEDKARKTLLGCSYRLTGTLSRDQS